MNRVDRDLFLSSESGETLFYLRTRSRATRSAEEARIEKKVGKKSEDERRERRKKDEHNSKTASKNTTARSRLCVIF